MRISNIVSAESLHLARNMLRARAGPRVAIEGTNLARAAIGIGAQQKRSEFGPFMAIVAGRRPPSVLEVGRGQGGSLWAFCQAASADATIVSVDLPDGPFGGSRLTAEGEMRLRGFAQPNQALHLVQGRSTDEEVVERVRLIAPRFDLIFIDGDHTYDGVRSDHQTYGPMAAPDGLVVFHDILPHETDRYCEVDQYWSTLSGSKLELVSPSEINEWSGGTWGGIGILGLRSK